MVAVLFIATGAAMASTLTSETETPMTITPQNTDIFGILSNSPFQKGDVFVSVGPNVSLGGGVVRHYDNNGIFVENLIVPNSGYSEAGMAFDSAGNLYVTLFGIQNVSKFNNTGAFQSYFGRGYNSNPESIVFDASGNVYVGQADGLRKILKFDPNGNPLANYSPTVGPRGTDWIDLAADQCTLFYTSEGTTIRRFNACTNTQQADFATGLPGSSAFALRILSNGEVLVADTNAVHRLNATGGIVKTYPKPPNATMLFALNLDPDGKSFWTGDIGGSGEVYKFDISTGTLLLTINTKVQGHIGDLGGIGVFGELTAAIPPKVPVPAFTPLGIVALAGLLGVLAVVTIRRRL